MKVKAKAKTANTKTIKPKKVEKNSDDIGATPIEVVEPVKESKFSKVAILASDKFARYRDVLKVVLQDGEQYTVNEVMDVLNKFLGRKV